jgi:anthranilate phosphoribosyltransferase
MAEITKYLEKVISRNDLTKNEAERVFQIIMAKGATPSQIGAIISALATKGEAVDEIYSAVKVMRSKMLKPQITQKIRDIGIIDCCGTGGDKKNTFNISTAVAFVLAASDLNVAKHGNRSISSKSGSADVLLELGVKLDLSVDDSVKCLEEAGISFLFAPLYHKAMAEVAPVRRELAIRTIFNLLGPLSNPALPDYQVIGVYEKSRVRQFAEVLKEFGTKSAIIVHGEDGMDEATICGNSYIAELKNGKISEYTINPEELGLKIHDEKELVGGNAEFNAKAMLSVLNGNENAYRDAVVLNAALGIYISGKSKDLKEAVDKAKELIKTGKAKEKLKKLVEVTQKLGLEND